MTVLSSADLHCQLLILLKRVFCCFQDSFSLAVCYNYSRCGAPFYATGSYLTFLNVVHQIWGVWASYSLTLPPLLWGCSLWTCWYVWFYPHRSLRLCYFFLHSFSVSLNVWSQLTSTSLPLPFLSLPQIYHWILVMEFFFKFQWFLLVSSRIATCFIIMFSTSYISSIWKDIVFILLVL